MNKKVLLLACLFSIFSVFAFAQNSNVRIEVSVKAEGLTPAEATTIVPSVFEKLEANLTKYTDFTILNNSNEQDILDIQAKSEGDSYQDSIAADKFHSATHELFTIVRNIDGEYTISVRFTDLAQRINKTFVSKARSDKKLLYSSNGCAVDELTIEICDAFGYPLDAVKKHIILHGEEDLNDEEMDKFYDEQMALYEKRVKQAQKDIEAATVSSDIDADIQRAKFESDKALAEEKLRQAKADKARLKEEARLKKEQEERDATRSTEQKNRIANMAKEAAMKAAQARKVKMDNESVLGQINIIELKKKALTEIFEKIAAEEDRITKVVHEDIKNKNKQIFSAPYRGAEKSGGKPTKKAIEIRTNNYRKARSEIIKNAKKQLEEINSTLASQRDSLLKDITREGNHLHTTTVNSLSNDLIVQYSSYDGDRYGWDLGITVKCDDVTLVTTKSFLSYEALTGTAPATGDEPDDVYMTYLDNVDYYDSLFLRGAEVLVFSLTYDVKPASLDKPSTYIFQFSDLQFNDTATLDPNSFTSSLSGDLSFYKGRMGVTQPTASIVEYKSMKTRYDMSPYETYLAKFNTSTSTGSGTTALSDKRYQVSYNMSYPKPLDTEGNSLAFGIYPATYKADNVTIDTSRVKNINGFICYRGSDDRYYYKETIHRSYYEDITAYFRMEYIIWQKVADNMTDDNGNACGTLYATHDILDGMQFGDDSDYINSDIRSYLTGTGKDDFSRKAFNPLALNMINKTAITTNGVKTEDKFFLLSRDEICQFMTHYSDDVDYVWSRNKRLVYCDDYPRFKGVDWAEENYTWTTSHYNEYLGEYVRSEHSLGNKNAGDYWLRDSQGSYVHYVNNLGYYYNKTMGPRHIAGIIPCFTILPEKIDY